MEVELVWFTFPSRTIRMHWYNFVILNSLTEIALELNVPAAQVKRMEWR
jgi:hypothetical protein